MRYRNILFILFIILFSSFCFAVPDGGISYYQLSDMNDQWGSNDATNEGSTSSSDYPTFDISGSGAPNSSEFDGSNDYIDISNSFGIFDDEIFSVSFWFKADSNSQRQTIVGFEGENKILMDIKGPAATGCPDSGEFCFWWKDTASSYENVDTTSAITTDVWHHVVAVADDDTAYIYFNGVLNATSSITAMVSESENSAIGGSGGYFDGEIDEVKIFNRALSEEEAGNLYNYGDVGGEIGISWENPTPDDGSKDNTQVTLNASCPDGDVSIWFDNSTGTYNKVVDEETSPASYTTSVTTEQTYYYFGSCDNGVTNSTIRTWTYDITDPEIIINPNNFFNEENTSSEIARVDRITEKLLNFTLVDNIDLFAYKINITNGSDYLFYNFTNSSLSGEAERTIIKNLNISTFPLGRYYVNIEASDSHTAFKIPKYQVEKPKNALRYNTEHGNEITISSRDNAMTQTEKSKDRYSFGFEFADKNRFADRTFDLYCDNELRYMPDSKYKGHFICSSDGIRGNWIDFEMLDNVFAKPNIRKVNKNHYVITFRNIGDKMTFNSIGGLNVNSQNYTFIVESQYPYNAYLEVAGQRQWNQSNEFAGNETVDINTTHLNEYIDNNCTISSCDIDFFFSFETQGKLEYSEIDINYFTNLTINIGDITTGELIDQQVDIDILEYVTTENLSTTDGTINIPEFDPTISTPTIIAESNGYVTNSRQFEFTDKDSTNITMYLLNSTFDNSANLIVQVYDDFSNLIAGANTKLLQYIPDQDSFVEVSQCYTDTNGECIFSIELNTEFYIVQATKEIDGETFFAQSTDTGQLIKLDNTIIPLYLKTTEGYEVDPNFDLIISVTNTSLVGNTSYLTATFNDPTNDEHEVCIGYFYRTGFTDTEITSTCVNGSSGIVNFAGGYVLDSTITNIAKIYIMQDGNKEIYDYYIYEALEDSFASEFSLYLKPFLLAILLGLLALSLYLKNIKIFAISTMVLSPTSIYYYPSWIGLTSISFIIILCIAIIYFTNKKQEI